MGGSNRPSALYATLPAAPDYYTTNRQCRSPLYTDHAIFSPQVPIFRDDSGALLEEPYAGSFITMPAVNAGAIPDASPDHHRVSQVMEFRIRCVLALAAVNGVKDLVLGAWGCGVFRNDPQLIASLFAKALREEASGVGRFERIVFAVLDSSGKGANHKPFARCFGS